MVRKGIIDDLDEWWRHRMGRLVVGDDEAVVRELLSRRSRGKVSGLATQWRAWTVERDWPRNAGRQVVVKAAGRRKSAAGVKASIRYVARLRAKDAAPVAVRDEFGRHVDPMTAFESWDLLSDQENLSRKARENPDLAAFLPMAERLHYVQAHHFVISPGVPANAVEAKPAFQRALHMGIDELFAAHGYRVLWAVHDDAKYMHAHVLLKAVSEFGQRLRLDIHGDMLDHLRQVFADALTRAGIPAQAVRREDRADLRAEIMVGQSFLRWPCRPGNGDLVDRAPAWFRQHGQGVVERMNGHSPSAQPKPSWWARLLTPKAKPVSRTVSAEIAAAVATFAGIYQDPVAALLSWRQLAAGERGKRAQALAGWYLIRQPEIFGAIAPHDDQLRHAALHEARTLPLLPAYPGQVSRMDGGWEAAYWSSKRSRAMRRNRNGVMRSLWHLARRAMENGSAGQARAILSRALMASWTRPIDAAMVAETPSAFVSTSLAPSLDPCGPAPRAIQPEVSSVLAPTPEPQARPSLTLPSPRTRPRSFGR